MPETLTVVVAPAEEPVTLDEAKLHCKVEHPDDDALIAALISAARSIAETRLRRAIVSTTFDAVYDSFPFGGGYYNRPLRQFYGAFPGGSGATFPGFLPTNTGILQLPRPALQSVTSIKYLDASGSLVTLDPSAYVVNAGVPGRVSPAYGKIWPTTLPMPGAVTVRFVAGYGDASAVPAAVKAAVKMIVANLYRYRESYAVGAGNNVAEIPDGAAALLATEDWGGYA